MEYSRFKALLVIPPDYDYNFPPLGTPALCAFLKDKGIQSGQIDLNISYRNFLLDKIKSSLPLSRADKKNYLKPLLKKFFIQRLKGRYYSHLLPRESDKIFPYLPYENNTNSSFYFTERLLSSGHLDRYLKDEIENTFYQFYRDYRILDYLKRERISLVGISIISPSQVIPSFTLGLLVKRYLTGAHVCIGGQWPTLYRQELLKSPELFNYFDSLVVFEGETPLYNLILSLKGKKDISLANIIFARDRFRPVFNVRGEDLNKLPAPDFKGLPLSEYEASSKKKSNLTFETSRGCYWSRCAYCVDLPLPKPLYRRKRPSLIIRDIRELKKRHRAAHLMLGDPGLSPRQMLEVSREIIRAKIKISWWCMARLDPGFNRTIFQIARQAGLRQVNFGFESANDRICRLLDKGNLKERSARIIRDCAESGIKVDLQTILGLPGETYADGLDTIKFLVENKKFISNVTFNTYYLTPSNYVYNKPKKYAIECLKNGELPFAFFLPFKNLKGMEMKSALALERIYSVLINKNSLKKKGAQIKKGKKIQPIRYIRFSLNQESVRLRYNN